MIYREDWDECKNRFEAFWQGEIIDRCCIAVTAPRSKPMDSKTEQREAKDLVEKWMSFKYRKNELLYEFHTTFYGGEAFPMFRRHLGAGGMSACIGFSFLLAEDTVWFDREPVIHN